MRSGLTYGGGGSGGVLVDDTVAVGTDCVSEYDGVSDVELERGGDGDLVSTSESDDEKDAVDGLVTETVDDGKD